MQRWPQDRERTSADDGLDEAIASTQPINILDSWKAIKLELINRLLHRLDGSLMNITSARGVTGMAAKLVLN